MLNSIIDITNRSFSTWETTWSYFLSWFTILACFKISLLIIALSIKNYNEAVIKKKEPEDLVHDNLFMNMRMKHMVRTHLMFWSKRWFIILLIAISPYIEDYITIIIAFVVLLGYFAYELDYRVTDNKREFLYVLMIHINPLIVSFMAMLMEGHYISYNSKYIAAMIMMVVVTLVYTLVIPLRMVDYYKLQPKQRQQKYEAAERISSTANVYQTTQVKDNALSVSQVSQDNLDMKPQKKLGFEKSPSSSPSLGLAYKGFSNVVKEKTEEQESSPDASYKWKKKSIASPSNITQGTSFNFLAGNSPENVGFEGKFAPRKSSVMSITEKSSVFSEESKTPYSEEFKSPEKRVSVVKSNVPSDLMGSRAVTPNLGLPAKAKSFNLPKF